MPNQRGRGNRGVFSQVRMTLTVDAGQGFFAVEEQLLRGVFRDGYRSDVMALLLQHWIEHPPDGVWMKKRWRKPLGVDWPEQRLPLPGDGQEQAEPAEQVLEEEAPL